MKAKLLTGLLIWGTLSLFAQSRADNNAAGPSLQDQMKWFDVMYDAWDQAYRREKMLLNPEDPIEDLKRLDYKSSVQSEDLGYLAKKYASLEATTLSGTYTKALAFLEEKKIENAIQLLNKIDVKDSPHLTLLAELHALNLNFTQAEFCGKALLKLDSTKVEHLLINAKLQRFNQNFAAAQKLCEKGQHLATANKLYLGYFALEQSLLFLEKKDFSQALQFANAFLQQLEHLKKEDPNDPKLLGLFKRAYSQIAEIHETSYAQELAIAAYDQQIKLAQMALLKGEQKMEAQLFLAEANGALTLLHAAAEDYQVALKYALEALKYWELVQKAFPNNLFIKYSLAYTHDRLGRIYWQLGNEKQAKEYLEIGNRMLQELDEVVPYNVTFRFTFGASYEALGDLYADLYDEAEPRTRAYKNALFLYEQLHTDWPHDHQIMHLLSGIYEELGDIYLQTNIGKQKAFEHFSYSWELLERLVANYPDSTDLVERYAYCYFRLGSAASKDEDAIAYFKLGIKILEPLLSKYGNNQDLLLSLAHAYAMLGENYRWEDEDASLEAYLQSKSLVEQLKKTNPEDIDWDIELGKILVELGQIYLDVNFKNKAELCLSETKALLAKIKAQLDPIYYRDLEKDWERLQNRLSKK